MSAAWGVLTALGITAAALATLAWIQAGQIRAAGRHLATARHGWGLERDRHGLTLRQLADERTRHTDTVVLLARTHNDLKFAEIAAGMRRDDAEGGGDRG